MSGPVVRLGVVAVSTRRLLQFLRLAAGLAVSATAFAPASAAELRRAAARQPNIVVILADDVGYGDLGCYGATRVKTPNLDRLAAQGLRFTDAHSTASTCTPSRYSLLTGQYAWRKKGTNILPGNANLILDPASTPLPSFLHGASYATGCIGKWHLGLGSGGKVDWNGVIQPGPLEVGFDYSFIIPATGDRVPTVFVEDHRVVGFDPNDPIAVSYGLKVGNEPTGRDNPELLKVKPSHGHDNTIVNGISRIGYQSGGKAAWWKDEEIADRLTAQATGFIEKNRDRPFFLYFATHDIHVPRVPHPRFVGSSQCGVRGDVIQELDWSVGEVMATLDRLKLADHTLVIFSSDNGPVVDDGYADGADRDLNGHKPAGPFRGGKYTIYEGGTRMPFLVRWPDRVKPGVSEALVCQVDFLASFASLVGKDLPADAGPDSLNVLPALLGESRAGRDHLVEQSGGLALRQGRWKYIPRADGGAAAGKKVKPDDRQAPVGQLYNLAEDPGETTDLAGQHPEIVKDLAALLQRLRKEGKSRPEAPRKP